MELPRAVAALAALAHETRLGAFRLLVAAGAEGVSAGRIAQTLDIPASTLSFHLKELSNVGLVSCTQKGRFVIYAMEAAAMRELLAFLTEDCCGGEPCGVERLAEAIVPPPDAGCGGGRRC